jgi:hypothetical protein
VTLLRLLPDLKLALVHALRRRARSVDELKWMAYCHDIDTLAQAVVSCDQDFRVATANLQLSDKEQDQMLALRGLLGHRCLKHCLLMVYRASYGLTSRFVL